MQKLVFINGAGNEIDLTAGNFGIVNWAGLSNTSLNIQTQQVPFEDGGVFLDALMEQREIEVTVAIYDGNNLELRYQKKRELISALNPKLGEGTLIYTNDYLSRQIKAVPQIPLFENKNSNDVGTLKASVAFSCCNPYWEDINDSVVLINSGETVNIENNGDVPCGMTIELYPANAEKPTIINHTNGKEIKYNDTLTNDLLIDTNTGNKIVQDKATIYNNIVYSNTYKNKVYFFQSKGLFIAVGKDVVYESFDGKNWKSIITTIIGGINDICLNPSTGLFVAVSVEGGVYTSLDCHTWNSQTSGVSTNLNSIKYIDRLDLFVAVGNSGTIITSEDGITWNSRTSNSTEELKSVCYGQNIGLVAVGLNSTIIYSSNAINWTVEVSSGTTAYYDVIFAQNKFVVVGGKIRTSSDGITWSEEINIGTSTLRSIIYESKRSLFIAVDMYQKIYSSTNGTDWDSFSIDVNTDYKVSITYSDAFDLYVIVGSNGTLATSKDLNNWNIIYGNIHSPRNIIRGMVYSKEHNIYLAVGLNYIYESTDGINWKTQQDVRLIYENTDLNDIIYVKELDKFVIVGDETIFTSTNGKDWNLVYTTSDNSLLAVCYSAEKNLFVAVGDVICKSTDGETWTENTPFEGNKFSIIYINDYHKFFIGGEDYIYTSEDGEIWEAKEVESGNYYSLAYSKEINTIVAFGLTAIVSTDGINWIRVLTTNFGNAVIYAEKLGKFIGTGMSIYTSANGYDWNIEQSLAIRRMYCLLYSEENDNILMGGESATIQYSTNQLDNNRINLLSVDSNMNFNLDIGINQVQIICAVGSIYARIKYRQKYIGV